MKINSVLLALCIFGLASCTNKTNLQYTSVIEERPKNQVSVSLQDFEDDRLDPEKIGALRNGYGFQLVTILTGDSVPKWVENALEEELTNAGYSVMRRQEEGYTIEGKIISAFSSTYFLYHGELIVELALKRGEEVLFQKVYENNKSGGICLQLSPYINRGKQSSKCSSVLTLNLQRMCRQFIEDVNQKLLHEDGKEEIAL